MAEIIRLKKGLNIPLTGAASNEMTVDRSSRLFGIVPDDYPGIKWRLLVKAGDVVLQGAPILEDKNGGIVKLVAPVSGTVVEIRRGERRHIDAVVIERSKEEPLAPSIDFSNKESIIKTLAENGLWALLRQRPFDVVPSTEAVFRDIFVTAFDSAPLASRSMVHPDDAAGLEKGLEILNSLTDGKVYLCVAFGSGISSKVAEVYEIQGPHPAGNVGVQIANIRPVNKGETVMTLNARTALRIGELALSGTLDFSTEVALTGSELKRPHHVRTTIGVSLADLLDGQIPESDNHKRVISGNVLTGKLEDIRTGFLRYPYRQVTVIPEGDDADEFMGWASMKPSKYSVKHSFLNFLHPPTRPYDFDARLRGGRRAMILSGEYDKVFPFDIYPEYLLKAILAKDIDKMEKLGIYEVAPEDFALPEFVDTSKNPWQEIVREGLDYLRAETL